MGTLPLSTEQDSPPSSFYQAQTMAPFPEIKSAHSLTAKHVTAEKWAKLGDHVTATSGFTLAKAIACAVEFDNQHCGIYAGDEGSYIDFADVFDPLICEYHGLPADFQHVSDMDPTKVNGNVNPEVPVPSVRIRVGRSIQGFGLSPGITKEQRVGVEKLVSTALKRLDGDLAGAYYPLAGMDRDGPEGRGIFHNEAKTFLVWVNEEDQTRIISMQKGGDVKGVFERLARGIKTVQDS